MSDTMASVVMALSIAFTAVLVEWIGRSRSPGRLFFLALGRPRSSADEARARRLRVVNAAVTLGGIGLVALPPSEGVAVAAAVACPLVSVGWLIGEMLGAIRTLELEPVPGRYAVPLQDGPRLRDTVSVPLQLINVLLVVVPCAVFAWLASRLPERVPLHFAVDGAVDRWGSPAELWTMAGILAFDLLLLWGITFAITKERWVLPPEEPQRYAALALERRRLLVRMVEWVIAAVNAGVALMWLCMVAASQPDWPLPVEAGIVASIVIMLFGTVLPLALLMRRLTKVSDQLRAMAGTEVLGTRASGWRWGGLIYYAPADPAVFVPKRVGIGQTVNMARPSAWLLLALIVLVPLAITFGGALLGGR